MNSLRQQLRDFAASVDPETAIAAYLNQCAAMGWLPVLQPSGPHSPIAYAVGVDPRKLN